MSSDIVAATTNCLETKKKKTSQFKINQQSRKFNRFRGKMAFKCGKGKW